MLKKIKTYSILTIIASLIIGVLFIVYPVDATRFAAYFMGVAMIAFGCYDLYLYFKQIGYSLFYRSNLFSAIFKLLIGACILLNIDAAVTMFGILFAVYVIASSVNTFEESIILKRAGISGWLVTLILSVVIMFCGLGMMVVPFETASGVAIYAGVVLIANAITGIVALVKIARVKKEFFDAYEIKE